jgi:DNA-binding transcriptional LysR family regulator
VARPVDVLSELRVADLTTFLAVRQSGSVTGAARVLGVTPSQVSKAVARLEAILRVRLFSRGSRGVALSEQARAILPHIEMAVSSLQLLGRSESPAIAELTIAAPSYLIASFLPWVARCLPQLQVRGIELAPSLVQTYASENFFEMAILPHSADRMPTTWVSVKIGELRSGLFATPDLACRLGPFPVSVQKLRAVPFIAPISNAKGRYIAANDACPLPVSERKKGAFSAVHRQRSGAGRGYPPTRVWAGRRGAPLRHHRLLDRSTGTRLVGQGCALHLVQRRSHDGQGADGGGQGHARSLHRRRVIMRSRCPAASEAHTQVARGERGGTQQRGSLIQYGIDRNLIEKRLGRGLTAERRLEHAVRE